MYNEDAVPAGNLLGLLVSPLLLHRFGWRALFYIFGFLGAPLLGVWQATVPDAPPQRSPAEQAGLTSGMAPGAADILPTATSETDLSTLRCKYLHLRPIFSVQVPMLLIASVAYNLLTLRRHHQRAACGCACGRGAAAQEQRGVGHHHRQHREPLGLLHLPELDTLVLLQGESHI